MSEHEKSRINKCSVESSPLSSPPSTCLSAPSAQLSSVLRPQPFSAPEAEPEETGNGVVCELPSSATIGDMPSGHYDSKVSPQSLRTIDLPPADPYKPAFPQEKPSILPRGNRVQRRLKIVKNHDSPPMQPAPAHQPLLGFFSSHSSNPGPWPPSPLDDKVNKSGYPAAMLGKRKAAGTDENDYPTAFEARKPKQTAAPLLNRNDHKGSSPDYKMMLNLSDTPPQLEAKCDPFIRSSHLDPMPSDYHLSMSRDPSLSPTIRNPSLGSLDSEELSAVCLKPAAEKRSSSFGLFACSGYLDEDSISQVTDNTKRIEMREIQQRRINEVMQRWVKSGISIDATSFELYKSPPIGYRNGRKGLMIALAPPRPVDRLSLEQHSRALEERSKWAASGFDASSGLLDAVCEAEAEVLQRGNEIRRPLSSLAPTDMHLPSKKPVTPPLHSQSHGLVNKALELRSNSDESREAGKLARQDCAEAQHHSHDSTVQDSVRPEIPPRDKARGFRKPFGLSHGRRRLKMTQSGATLALIVKESARECFDSDIAIR